MPLTQPSRELDIPKSTLLNLLCTLEESVYVYKTRQIYRLGYKIMRFIYSMRSAFSIVQFALTLIEEMQAAPGEFVYLTTHINGRVLYPECVYPRKRTVGYSITGKTLPMHCTDCGKAMLSLFAAEQVDSVINVWGIERELELTRARGYAIDEDEEPPASNASPCPCSQVAVLLLARSAFSPQYTARCVKILSDMTSILATRVALFPSMQISSPFIGGHH